MRNKKLLATSLASVMVLSTLLSGCGGDDAQSSAGGESIDQASDSDSSAASDDSTTADDGAASDDGASQEAGGDREKVDGLMYAEGLPIVDDGAYSFSLFVDAQDGGNTLMFPVLKEQTGVDVEVQGFAYDIAQEKYSLALGSGDYADCIGGWILRASDVLTYGVDMGIFVPLEEYFEKYCPKITEVLNLEGVREAMTAPDGHIYSIPYAIEAPLVDYNPYINNS